MTPRGLRPLLAVAGLLVAAPGARAQGDGALVGLVAGGARTTQLWRPPAPTEAYTGALVGAFADAPTSLRALSVRAEAAWVRRGGDVELQVDGVPSAGRIRADYLSVVVHARLGLAYGRVRAYVTAGPTLDQTLRTRLDPVLAQVLDVDTPVVFAVGVGAGIGVWLDGRAWLGADVRLTEGVGDAHAGGFTHARDRSLEAVVRLGVPLALLRGG